jgi:hypothetical protein
VMDWNNTAGFQTGNETVLVCIYTAAYWCVGLESKIPPRANVDIVGTYNPTWFGFGKHRKNVKPADYAMP